MPNETNGVTPAEKKEKTLVGWLTEGAYNQVEGRALVMAEYLLMLRDMNNALEEAKKEMRGPLPVPGEAPRPRKGKADRLATVERVCKIIAQKMQVLKAVANYQEKVVYKARAIENEPKAVPMPQSTPGKPLGTARGGLAGTFSTRKTE